MHNEHHEPLKCKIGRTPDGYWIGVAALPLGHTQFTVQDVVWERPIARQVRRQLARRMVPILREYIEGALEDIQGAHGDVEIGIFGFFKKIWRKVKKVVRKTWKTVKLVAKAIVSKKARRKLIAKLGRGIKKLGRFVKKVYTHPIFAVALNALGSAVPGLQPGLGVAYALSRAAMSTAEKLARGDPSAMADAARAVQKARGGHPGAQRSVDWMKWGKSAISQAIPSASMPISIPGFSF